VTELAGVMVNGVCREPPFRLAVMVAALLVLTDAVVMGKDVRM
jgi:NhaP-type Na+/H+ or K+/H+ antiporter